MIVSLYYVVTVIFVLQGMVGDKKGTSGWCFNLVSHVISWLSKKQTNVALNTTKNEYIVVCSSCDEAVWIHKLLTALFDTEMDATDIYCDNQICIKLTKKPLFHDNSKKIEIKYHYIWDMVYRRAINIQYVLAEEQFENVLTKTMSCMKFEYF